MLREAAQLLCAVMACLWLAGCDDDYADNVSTARNQLEVSVKTNLTKAGTGLITGNFLPDGATLGVTLRKSDGSRYDGQDYTNVLYTASGTESEQTWAGPAQNPILLSATEGTAYAYFPRQADLADITQIPISNETETDYMYSAPAENISIANKTASFQMSHVMSVIRVSVVKGNYTGVGSIETLQVKGNTAATSAKLNVLTQELTDITGAGTAISKTGSWTFTSIGTQDLWAVPAETTSPLQFTVGVDGNNLLATSETLELLPGKIYTYTLTINSNELKISKVTVTDWDIIPKDNLTPEPALTWATAPDGVYAVSADVTPVKLEDADASCIGVAIVNRATNQCLMIEKYGEKNASYKEAHIAYGGYNVTSAENDPENAEGYYSIFAWGGDNIVYENISSASSIDGSADKVEQGTFDQEGEYYISSDPATWTNGALADFNGKQNKPYLSTILSNNNDVDLNCTPIGYAMNYYNESDDNQGFDDWFVPSLGQLSLIWVNQTVIDQALEKIGGTLLIYERPLIGTDAAYCSSTQCDKFYSTYAASYAVRTESENMLVCLYPRFQPVLLRFVRDLSGDNTRHFPTTAGGSIASNGHTINLIGDKTGLSISQKTAADGTVTLYVSADDISKAVNSISVGEGCTVKQISDFNNNRSKITLSGLTADIDVTFAGVSSKTDALVIDGTTTGMTIDKTVDAEGLMVVTLTPSSSDTYINTGYTFSGACQKVSEEYQTDGSLILKLKVLGVSILSLNGVANFLTATTAPDGVYCIWPEEKLASGGGSFCSGVALINSATSQKLMIEKFEDANNPESANVYKTAAQQLGSASTNSFSWGGYGTTSGTFLSTNVGDGSSDVSGYLPMPDGNYTAAPNLNGNPSVWITTTGALSDFGGQSNSQIIKNILDNGTRTSSDIAPMAYLMNAFNDAGCSVSVNQGYTDWFIPSCGQLGLMWLNKTDINNALTNIGGTRLSESLDYWTSSEYSSEYGWYVSLRHGLVDCSNKAFTNCVRLVRNL